MRTNKIDYENAHSNDEEYVARIVRKLAYEAKCRSRHRNRGRGEDDDFDVFDDPDRFDQYNAQREDRY